MEFTKIDDDFPQLAQKLNMSWSFELDVSGETRDLQVEWSRNLHRL